MGHIGLIVAYYGGLEGILTGLTKSTDHPSVVIPLVRLPVLGSLQSPSLQDGPTPKTVG